jgi:3-oxoacyl-[acyl-carrier-protein] synthase II
MPTADRDALITGIGLISCLGEGPAAHWAALDRADGPTRPEPAAGFAPFLVHPMVALELDRQIPKRGDQRQMEAWQRIGTYAAGLALDHAAVKGDSALLARMHMIVAAGGGERDCAVDAQIMGALPHATDPGATLNQHLLTDLRPTLFLAQLSNLLAGNISIVHGVVGSSRTFMGEETAGADAVRIACARIGAGQVEQCLVGGSFNAERPDVVLHYAMGGVLTQAPPLPVWERQAARPGMALGSVGCFLVIESRAHAARRGAPGLARIDGVRTDRGARRPGEATATAAAQVESLLPGGVAADTGVISAASGAAAATREEAAFLKTLGRPVRAFASATGHSMEPAFPTALALAALCIGQGRLFAPQDAAEAPMPNGLDRVLVTGWGHWRGEATALLSRA